MELISNNWRAVMVEVIQNDKLIRRRSWASVIGKSTFCAEVQGFIYPTAETYSPKTILLIHIGLTDLTWTFSPRRPKRSRAADVQGTSPSNALSDARNGWFYLTQFEN
ncbi:hypothetical protein EVAR_102866_1 [Eumeta japonica]|uniref:Uncharacterized protein n=1 Tax=Eumeta variegata TaxID=151549 RepID=A0A4C1UNS2_EUMVA|nr:hypothetical protein EVAR_102866_1 [Eumeta japonica]